MSKSIVKQSLEIFEYTSEIGKSKSSLQKKQKAESKKGKFTKSLGLDKKYSGKTIDQVRKQISKQKDRTEENLLKLSTLSKNRVSQETTSSIFKRASRSREEPETVKPVEGTVFTEEDFAMFEREFLVD